MSGTGEKVSATTKTPADFLKSIRGRPVVVKLNSGVDYRGQSFLFSPCFHWKCFTFSQFWAEVFFILQFYNVSIKLLYFFPSSFGTAIYWVVYVIVAPLLHYEAGEAAHVNQLFVHEKFLVSISFFYFPYCPSFDWKINFWFSVYDLRMSHKTVCLVEHFQSFERP